MWLFISEPVFIELLIVLRSSQYILKWWNKTGFFHNEIHVHVYLYFLRLPCLSQKIYINCLKKLCRHHPILNQNSSSWLSFVLQANKNQYLSLTNLLQKKLIPHFYQNVQGKKACVFYEQEWCFILWIKYVLR